MEENRLQKGPEMYTPEGRRKVESPRKRCRETVKMILRFKQVLSVCSSVCLSLVYHVWRPLAWRTWLCVPNVVAKVREPLFFISTDCKRTAKRGGEIHFHFHYSWPWNDIEGQSSAEKWLDEVLITWQNSPITEMNWNTVIGNRT